MALIRARFGQAHYHWIASSGRFQGWAAQISLQDSVTKAGGSSLAVATANSLAASLGGTVSRTLERKDAIVRRNIKRALRIRIGIDVIWSGRCANRGASLQSALQVA